MEFDEWYSSFRNIEEIVDKGVSVETAVEMSDDIENSKRFAQFILGKNFDYK